MAKTISSKNTDRQKTTDIHRTNIPINMNTIIRPPTSAGADLMIANNSYSIDTESKTNTSLTTNNKQFNNINETHYNKQHDIATMNPNNSDNISRRHSLPDYDTFEGNNGIFYHENSYLNSGGGGGYNDNHIESNTHLATMANIPQHRYNETTTSVLKKRPGRPKGSKNKPKSLSLINRQNNHHVYHNTANTNNRGYIPTTDDTPLVERESPRLRRKRQHITTIRQHNYTHHRRTPSNLSHTQSLDNTQLHNSGNENNQSSPINIPSNASNLSNVVMGVVNGPPPHNENNGNNLSSEFATETILQDNADDHEFKTMHILAAIPASDIFKREIIEKVNEIVDDVGVVRDETPESTVSCFLFCNNLDACIERDTLLAKNVIFITNHGFFSIVHQQIYVVHSSNCHKSHCTYVIHEHDLPIAYETSAAISNVYRLLNL